MRRAATIIGSRGLVAGLEYAKGRHQHGEETDDLFLTELAGEVPGDPDAD
jgi:hypothetical protein